MTTFSPAEVVEQTGFSIETLRYYERIGLLRDVARDSAGHRVFGDDHLAWLEILRCLRDTGMPIAQMQRYVELAAQDGSVLDRLSLLREHDKTVTHQIAELRRWRRHLHDKIAYYQGELEHEQRHARTAGDDR